MPNKVKLVHPHSKFVVMFNLSFENFFRPIQITLVFSLFIFKPDKFPYISRVFRADCKECWLPFSISVVSSANCVSLNSLFIALIHPIQWTIAYPVGADRPAKRQKKTSCVSTS